MHIGKVKKIHHNIPGTRPVKNWPRPAKEQPIRVPNWPTKKPVTVPAGK